MTRAQLLEECLSMEAPQGYRFAIDMASGSMALGDAKFAEVAADVACEMLERRLHKPVRNRCTCGTLLRRLDESDAQGLRRVYEWHCSPCGYWTTRGLEAARREKVAKEE